MMPHLRPASEQISPVSHSRLLRRDIEIPINCSIVSVPLLQPLICLGEVLAIILHPLATVLCKHHILHSRCTGRKETHKAPHHTQRTRMHTLQDAMPRPINLRNPLPRRHAPRQKHHPFRPLLRHNINDLLRESLPSLIRVARRLVSFHCQTCIQQQDTAIGPGGEEAALVRGRLEVRVLLCEELVDVEERGGRGGGGPDGEAETVGLVDVVVGVLAQDYTFDR